MGIADIMVLLFITIGPSKAAAMYLSATAGADPALKRAIAIRTVSTAAIICGTFAVAGQALLGFFHVSLPALLIAGGLILFVFALHLVLGEDHEPEPGAMPKAPSLSLAAYPLAMPMMASPQGLVAIVTISAVQPGLVNKLILLALVLVQMAINIAFLLFADRIFKKVSPDVLKVVMRIFGLLLCGLAVQLCIEGLKRLGVLTAVAGH